MAKRKYTPDKNGIYSTLVWDGTYTPDGRKHRKQLRSKKSSADLERQVKQFQAQVEARKIVQATDMTFCEYAAIWLQLCKPNAELNTRKIYENVIYVHFHKLASVRLDSVSRVHLLLLLGEVNPPTGEKIYMTFNQVIQSAVHDKYISPAAAADIFAGIQRPRAKPTESRPLTEPERKAVFSASYKKPMDQAFAWIIYGCGLRREEAIALTVFDIDLKRANLAVKRAIAFDGNNPCIKDPKTKNGRRSVPLPGFLADFLPQYIKSLSGSLLFHTAAGKPMTKSAYDRMWGRIRDILGATLEEPCSLTAHNFRHNYCTMLCYQIPSISIKRIAQLLGDTERVVLKIYNHILAEKEDAAGAVERALSI